MLESKKTKTEETSGDEQLRELHAALAWIRVAGEETVLAGLPGGDRNQTLANIRGRPYKGDDWSAEIDALRDAAHKPAP